MWQVLQSASAYAQLAGWLAGVAFVALTLILTRDIPASRTNAGDDDLTHVIVADFLLAFVTLVLAALTWTVLTGNPEGSTLLLTTRIGATAANVLLATGGVLMLSGVCHLVVNFEVQENQHEAGDLRSVACLAYILIVGVVTFLAVNDLLRLFALGLSGSDEHWAMAIFVVAFVAAAAVAGAASLPAGSRFRRRIEGRPGGRPYRRRRRFLTVGVALACIVLYMIGVGERQGSLAYRGCWAWDTWAPAVIVLLLGTLGGALVLFAVQGWSLREGAHH